MRRNRASYTITSADRRGPSTATNFAWAKFVFAQDDGASAIVPLSFRQSQHSCHSDPSEYDGRNLLFAISQGTRD
jgi:hypothetical protein